MNTLLLRRKQVALWMGVSVRTLARMEKDGVLKARRIRPGGHPYYAREDIEAFVEARAGKKFPVRNGGAVCVISRGG